MNPQQTNPAPEHDEHCDGCGREYVRVRRCDDGMVMCLQCRPAHLRLVVDNGKR